MKEHTRGKSRRIAHTPLKPAARAMYPRWAPTCAQQGDLAFAALIFGQFRYSCEVDLAGKQVDFLGPVSRFGCGPRHFSGSHSRGLTVDGRLVTRGDAGRLPSDKLVLDPCDVAFAISSRARKQPFGNLTKHARFADGD